MGARGAGLLGGAPRLHMINSRHISVVLPAYNAETTLLRTVAELDREIIDDIVLVDDAGGSGCAPRPHDDHRSAGGRRG